MMSVLMEDAEAVLVERLCVEGMLVAGARKVGDFFGPWIFKPSFSAMKS